MSAIIRRALGMVPSGRPPMMVNGRPVSVLPRTPDVPRLPGPASPDIEPSSRFPWGAAAAGATAAGVGAGVAAYNMGGGEQQPDQPPVQTPPGASRTASSGDGLPDGYSSWAAGMAEAETGMTTAQRIAAAEAQGRKWDSQKAAYDRDTGLGQPYQTPVSADDIRAEDEAKAGRARASWDKWVGGSTERQGRFDPVESDARVQQSFDDHLAFDRKFAADPKYGGRTPEEVNRAGLSGDFQRKQWLKTMGNRYRNELANGTITMAQLAAEYDSGAAGQQAQGGTTAYGNEAHKAGAKSARNLTDMLDGNKAAQIGLNIDNNWRQINIARQLGVSRGHIIAMEDIQKSLNAGDHGGAAAKMAMYGMPPEAYRSMMAMTAGIAEAKAKAPVPEVGLAQKHANEMGTAMQAAPGMRLGAVRAVAQALNGGPDADPKAIDAAVQSQMQGVVSAAVGQGVDNLPPEHRQEIQQIVRGMSYGDFQRYVGHSDSPQLRDTYKKLTGNSTGFFDTVGTAGSNLVDWMVPDALYHGIFGGGPGKGK